MRLTLNTPYTSLVVLLIVLAQSAVAQGPLYELSSPDVTYLGHFGHSVAAVPGADGAVLLLVGAAFEDDGSSPLLSGRVHLYDAGTGAHVRTLVSPNEEFVGGFGIDVAAVPDVDDDGYNEVLVGAYQESPGTDLLNVGRAYLFSGRTGVLLHPFASPHEQENGWFADHVAGVPDVDGDGRGDVLIAASAESVGSLSDAGRVYVFSGATGELLHELVSPNAMSHGYFGKVAGVADADGDGRGDLLVGAKNEAAGGQSGAGKAYLFSGATGALIRELTSPNEQEHGNFGYAVSGVSDADGDGTGDLLVGAIGERAGSGPQRAGRVHLLSGATGAPILELTPPEEQEIGHFGYAVSGAPDVDGDGQSDLLVGVPDEDIGVGSQNSGRAHLFSGATGAHLQTLGIPNGEPEARFGSAVAGLEDLDGDGNGDLLIGAYSADTSEDQAGRAFVFSGATATAAEPGPDADALAAAIAPNPSRDTATLSFALEEPSSVRLVLYDVLGRELASEGSRSLGAGTHRLVMDVSLLPSGVYAWWLDVNGEVRTGRLTVAK